MKKAWIFLIVVALLTLSVPIFADGPTVKFSMLGFWWANYDPAITTAGANAWVHSGAQRVWPTADIALDANNTLEVALRFANGTNVNTQAGLAVPASPPVILSPTTLTTSQFNFQNSLWHFMWTSDLTKSAGMGDLPVDVKVTVGVLDSVLTNWWYDNNGWEWEYGGSASTPGSNWDSQLVTINADSNFIGYSWAVGFGPIILHWVNDFSYQNTLLGAEASYMGAGLFVAYGIYNGAAIGNGDVAIEAKYDVPDFSGMGLILKPSAFFRTNVNGPSWVAGADVTVGYQIYKLIIGATSTNMSQLAHYSATVKVAPIDPAEIWIGAYLDNLSTQGALQAVDIGATYKFGAFKAIVGWVIGGKDQTQDTTGVGTNPNAGNNVTLGNDNVGGIRNGLYIGSAINF